MVKMTEQEMFTYIKRFNNRSYNTEVEAREDCKKLERLLAKFGFKFESSFGARCRPMTNQDTSCFYRKQLAEYEYHEIQLGVLKDKVYTGKNRGKKHYLEGFKGLCRLDLNHKVSLNPQTGKPWQIGDIDYSNKYNPAMLTKRGWYTGD